MKHFILFAILIAMNMHPAIVANDLPPVAVQQVSSPGRSYFYSGETVTFSGAGSYDQDESGASVTYYEWYVDGAYKAGGSSKSTWTTSFSVASGQTTVSIKLRVRDDENNWSEQTTSYTVKAKPGRVYYLKDHLGSVRTSVDENGHVIGYDDYYAFGLVMPGRSSNSGNPNDEYKYTGHELDNEANLNLYYAGARYLDPVLGRWLSVDPLADEFPGWSPYNYSFNNPLRFMDPDGRAPVGCPPCWPSVITPERIKTVGKMANAMLYSFANSVSTEVGRGSARYGEVPVGYFDQVESELMTDAFGSEGLGRAAQLGVGVLSAIRGNPKKLIKSGGEFEGVRKLSNTLQESGVGRKQRLEVIGSFKEGTIQAKKATGSENVLRYFGGESNEVGRFLTPSFPRTGSAGSRLALPPGNTASGLTQFKLREGALFFEGVAGQNFGKPGGGVQIFIPNLEDLRGIK